MFGISDNLLAQGSIKSLAALADAQGMKLVATPQRGHVKEYTPLTLADVANVIKATNDGLLFRAEMNAIVARFNRQGQQAGVNGPIAVVYVNEQGLLDYMVSL